MSAAPPIPAASPAAASPRRRRHGPGRPGALRQPLQPAAAAAALPLAEAGFNASYTELGVLLTIFFVVSCAVQALSGFVVDRFGPRPVLFAGIGLLALAAFGYAVSTSYAMLVFFAVVAGIGNGVFHPVDYTLLNRKVHPKRLGHAFSVHGITGSLGWALAPAMMVSITLASSWRVALASAGVLTLVVLGVLWLNRAQLATRDRERRPGRRRERGRRPRRQLRLPDDSAVWVCFGFFFLYAIVISGIQAFAPGGGAPAARGAGCLGGDVPDLLHGRQRRRHGARRLPRHRSGALRKDRRHRLRRRRRVRADDRLRAAGADGGAGAVRAAWASPPASPARRAT